MRDHFQCWSIGILWSYVTPLEMPPDHPIDEKYMQSNYWAIRLHSIIGSARGDHVARDTTDPLHLFARAVVEAWDRFADSHCRVSTPKRRVFHTESLIRNIYVRRFDGSTVCKIRDRARGWQVAKRLKVIRFSFIYEGERSRRNLWNVLGTSPGHYHSNAVLCRLNENNDNIEWDVEIDFVAFECFDR